MQQKVQDYAQLGASVRLTQIAEEQRRIFHAFPELKKSLKEQKRKETLMERYGTTNPKEAGRRRKLKTA